MADMPGQMNDQAPVEEQPAETTAPSVEQPADEVVDPSNRMNAEAQPAAPEIAFSWQASEFVHNHKSIGWYAILWGAIVFLMAGAALLQLWLYIAVFLVMGIAVMVYARMPPRTMTYELSDEGVHINGKVFPFADFRSFGVMPDDDWHAIDLEPAKRFSPRVVLLFDGDDFDSIVGHLELHLPRLDRELDMVERATKFLRF